MCKQQIISGTAPVSLSHTHTQESDGEFMGGGGHTNKPQNQKELIIYHQNS